MRSHAYAPIWEILCSSAAVEVWCLLRGRSPSHRRWRGLSRDLDHAIHGDAFDIATTDREFTLAIADVGQVVKLPGVVARLGATMPHARLRVLSIDTLFALGGLTGPEIDVAIGAGEKGPGVHARPLHQEHLMLVARAVIRLSATRHQVANSMHCGISRSRSRKAGEAVRLLCAMPSWA